MCGSELLAPVYGTHHVDLCACVQTVGVWVWVVCACVGTAGEEGACMRDLQTHLGVKYACMYRACVHVCHGMCGGMCAGHASMCGRSISQSLVWMCVWMPCMGGVYMHDMYRLWVGPPPL